MRNISGTQVATHRSMKTFLASTLASMFLVTSMGCSHTVTIDSEPSGAEISVNGIKIGNGPVQYEEKTGWEKVYTVDLKKGGKKKSVEIKQTEWNTPVIGGSVGGAVVLALTGFATLFAGLPLIGLFWSKQLPDQVTIPLKTSGGSDTGGNSTYDYGY